MSQTKNLTIIICLAVLSSCQIKTNASFVEASIGFGTTENEKFELYLDELWESNLKTVLYLHLD